MLRALQEAGVKIDLVAGRGMGTVSAMFAAVDGGSRLWESGGLWRDGVARRFYRWRASLRAAAWMLAAASATLLFPLVFLVAAVLVYPVAYLFRLAGSELGTEIAAGYGQLLDTVFGPTALPLILPRVVVLILLGLLVLLATQRRVVRMVAGATAGARRDLVAPVRDAVERDGRPRSIRAGAVEADQRRGAEYASIRPGAEPRVYGVVERKSRATGLS